MKKAHLIILATLILAACGTTRLIQPTQVDADRGAQKYSNLTLADLNQGKAIFEQNCGICHGLKKPTSRNEDQWNKIVPDMTGKVNKKKGAGTIDGYSQEIMLKYLITMSLAKTN